MHSQKCHLQAELYHLLRELHWGDKETSTREAPGASEGSPEIGMGKTHGEHTMPLHTKIHQYPMTPSQPESSGELEITLIGS